MEKNVKSVNYIQTINSNPHALKTENSYVFTIITQWPV